MLALALLALLSLGMLYAAFASGNQAPPFSGQVPSTVGEGSTPVAKDAAPNQNADAGPDAAGAAPTVQDVYVRALGGADFGAYDKTELTVKKGVPVRLHFSADADAGCGRSLVVYGLNVRLTAKNGQEAVAEFTPQEAGTYEYSCSMRMFGPGKLIVQ